MEEKSNNIEITSVETEQINTSKEEEHIKPYVINCQVGNDNGNSEHDISINGYQICQPNVISKIRKLPLLDEIHAEDIINNIESNLLVTVVSQSVEPGIYYIGEYALKSGETIRNIRVGTLNNKSESDIVVINTLAQIAGYAVKQVFSKIGESIKEKEKIGPAMNNKKILVNVDMTTAVPMRQFDRKVGEEFAERFMGTTHNITVQLGPSRVSVEIVFKYVKVIPEGVTAVHAFRAINKDTLDMLSDFKKLYPEEKIEDGSYFAKKRILHVAIGEGTTEYPITDGLGFKPQFVHGTNNGVGIAIEKALPEFKDKNMAQDYSRQMFSEVFRNESHKYHDSAVDCLSQYLEEEASHIFNETFKQIERTNNEIDIIAVYGGGSIPMRDYLEKQLKTICDKIQVKLLYIPEKYAVILESMGMYAFTKGPIFAALKKRAANTNQ